MRAPILILCLARPELLDARPGWGGGRVRSTAIELEPLSEEESAELVEQLLNQLAGAAGERPESLPQEALDRAEGNPLFVEETIRMLIESGSGNGSSDRVPDTLQALIAARIDHLAPDAKTLLQRASVIGRVFWKGALEHLSPDVTGHEALLDDLLQREFLLREPRSSISGETAYRFKHAMIREVAYTGMAKLSRAQYHARFAEWLAERTGEELVEIRAYHLDRAVEFLTELEGAPPGELADDAAEALVKAAKRAMAREAYPNARTLGLRAVELRPTLGRTVRRSPGGVEAPGLDSRPGGDGRRYATRLARTATPTVEASALTALAEASLKRDGDAFGARDSVDEALELLAAREGPGRPLRSAQHAFARRRLAAAHRTTTCGTWSAPMPRPSRRAARTSRRSLRRRSRRRTWSGSSSRRRSSCITRALELADESGSVRARMSATLAYGWFLRLNGELDAAETVVEEVRATAEELDLEPAVAASLMSLGWIARRRGDLRSSEKLFREAVRVTSGRGDHGLLPDYQAALATTLADLGKVDEAERLALDAAAHAVREDTSGQVFVITALASVRAAQGATRRRRSSS